jgi:hypothetical protein
MGLESNMLKIRGNTTTKNREVQIPIDTFKGGVNKLLDEARIAPTEAKTALNLISVQDGLWKPRWGTAYYGADIGDTIDGAKEFVKSDGTTELVAVSNGKAWKSTDGSSWTEISGATFTADLQCYFMQIAGYLYIANGTDNLVRYDGNVLTTYSSLNAPTGLTASLVASGLSSGTYVYYAEVTALNEVGETTGSTEASITCNKVRDSWTSTSDKITWSWDAVAGATRYQLYLSDEMGRETFLTSTTVTQFTDDGTTDINPYIETPTGNSTTAPKFKSMCISGNRIWATNDSNNKYMVYFSGTGVDIGKFANYYGGGWINLEKGGREMPTAVVHYQSGQGVGRLTTLCRTPEGRGAIWQIDIESLTVGDTAFPVPSAVKVVGSFGTDSINGVVATNNDILFPNRRGVYSLGPEKNYYGILRTNELSVKVRPYWTSLIGSKIGDIASYFYDAKVFISVPTNTTGNNRTIVYDTERMNWSVDWSIGGKQFLEYTDTTGNNHFLMVPNTGNQLVELSENISGDLGVAFNTDYTSGRMPLNKLWKDFLKVNKVFIKLGNPRGAINFEVSGTEKSNPFSSVKTATIINASSNTGMGFDVMGRVVMGRTLGVPTTYSDSSDPHYLKIRKKLRDIQLRVTTTGYDTDYVLQGFIIQGNSVKVTPPSNWKLN